MIKLRVRDILQLDYREEENKEVIQNMLKKIKPFSKYENEDVEISKIEKFIGVATKKYDLYVRDIMFASIVTDNNEILYNLHLYRESDLQIICEIYGCELYELMAKTAIYIYALIKNEKVRKRDEV